MGAARAPRRAPGGSLGSLRGARGPLWAPVRRLPSAWVAPVASERSSAATFGRERSREWLPKRPSASPRGAIHTVKQRLFAGRLLAEVGVQGSPWAPGRRFQDPKRSPQGRPNGNLKLNLSFKLQLAPQRPPQKQLKTQFEF